MTLTADFTEKADAFSAFMPAKFDLEINEIALWLESGFEAARRSGGMVTFTRTITPRQAEYILKNHNLRNRPINSANLRRFVAVIKNEEFRLSSQGIAFDKDNNLADGQHRLLGCFEAGVQITIRVTFGEDANAFEIADSGKPRNNADTLALMGYKNWTGLAAAARLLAGIESGANASARLTNAQVVEVVKKYPFLVEAVEPGMTLVREFGCPSGPAIVACYRIQRSSRAPMLPDFLNALSVASVTPAVLRNGAMMKLREGLSAKDLNKNIRHPTKWPVCIAACIIKAFNSGWVNNEDDFRKWSERDKFPEVA